MPVDLTPLAHDGTRFASHRYRFEDPSLHPLFAFTMSTTPNINEFIWKCRRTSVAVQHDMVLMTTNETGECIFCGTSTAELPAADAKSSSCCFRVTRGLGT